MKLSEFVMLCTPKSKFEITDGNSLCDGMVVYSGEEIASEETEQMDALARFLRINYPPEMIKHLYNLLHSNVGST